MKKAAGKNPTIRDVAKLAGVGVMTVSRVINQHPKLKPSTKKRVEMAIAQLGYRQNEAARLLKGQRARLIGLIVPDLSDGFFATCAHTVQHIARSHGYMTLVASSERDPEQEIQQAELMADRMVSGLLLVTSMDKEDDRFTQLQADGLSIVAFDRPLPGTQTDAVLVENRAGAEEATQHLIDHGHRRIACIGYDETVYTIDERIRGYRHCMQSFNLKPNVVVGLSTFEDVRSWLASIMRSKARPTAIFSSNHRTSTFLMKALVELGVRVPEEIAVVGFDDFELASALTPALTTVAQPPADLARRSMALLMERIKVGHHNESHSREKILLPTRLVLRQSCGHHE